MGNKWPLLFCPESEEVRWSPYIVHRLTSARRTRHYHPGIPNTVWSRLLTNACNIMGLIYLLTPRDFFHERKMQSKHYRFFFVMDGTQLRSSSSIVYIKYIGQLPLTAQPILLMQWSIKPRMRVKETERAVSYLFCWRKKIWCVFAPLSAEYIYLFVPVWNRF